MGIVFGIFFIEFLSSVQVMAFSFFCRPFEVVACRFNTIVEVVENAWDSGETVSSRGTRVESEEWGRGVGRGGLASFFQKRENQLRSVVATSTLVDVCSTAATDLALRLPPGAPRLSPLRPCRPLGLESEWTIPAKPKLFSRSNPVHCKFPSSVKKKETEFFFAVELLSSAAMEGAVTASSSTVSTGSSGNGSFSSTSASSEKRILEYGIADADLPIFRIPRMRDLDVLYREKQT